MSEYKSPMRTSYRKPIVIDSNDPRVQTKFDIEKYRSRAGAEIIVNETITKNIDIEEIPTDCWVLATDYEYATGSDYNYQQFSLIANDSENNIVCSGNYDLKQDKTSDTNINTVLIKFSENGDLIWQIFLDEGTRSVTVRDIKIDKNDNIYITGSNTDADFDGSFIAKFSKNGTKIWSKRIYIEDAGFSSYMLPSNIQFDNSETNLYLVTSRYHSRDFSYDPLYFHLYEINMSSGNLIRSNRYYGYKPSTGYLDSEYQPSFDDNVSICYANNNLYIFGQLFFGSTFITWIQTERLTVLKINLSNFEIESVVNTDRDVYDYFTTDRYYSIFYKNKLYLCPSSGQDGAMHIYEYDNINSIKDYRIMFSPSSINYDPERVLSVSISSFQQDSSKNFIISGICTGYLDGDEDLTIGSFVIKVDPIFKKIKTVNVFYFKNPWTQEKTKMNPGFEGGMVSFNNKNILFSGFIIDSQPWNPDTNSKGLFLFKIPYNPYVNTVVGKSNVQIKFPTVVSGHYFFASTSKELYSAPVRTIPLVPGYEYFKITDNSLYSDTTYSVIRNDTQFRYEKTEF